MKLIKLTGTDNKIQCVKCKHYKEASNEFFSPSLKMTRGFDSWCRECKNQKQREYNSSNKTNKRNKDLKWMYGITHEDYELMLAKQDFKCAICSSTEPKRGRHFFVDHDHKTGQVRGLLCCPCNMGIGQLQDNPDFLRAGANYLEKK